MNYLTSRRLLLVAAPLALLVIVVGAFTRLSDAGLGCPDWPGCYGQLIGTPDAQTAAQHSPAWPLDEKKARIEIAHRYVAALLGLLIFAAAALSYRHRPRSYAPWLLAVFVLAQGLLGMLTVTERLRPVVVSAHLLGGMLIIATIAFALSSRPLPHRPAMSLRVTAVLAAMVLAGQIFLGGWVSANYAALACPDFPLCQNKWLPPHWDWSGFNLSRALHQNVDGTPISAAALMTIHWAHRVGAVVAALALGILAVFLWREKMRAMAVALLFLLAAQWVLGMLNVLAALPLWSALAHNAVAALLAAKMGLLMAKLFHPSALR